MRAIGSTFVALALWSGPAAAFDLQGHRGTRGHMPENTLPAFKKAIEIGVTTLETDLALTRDGYLVLSHDPLLNPDLTRDDTGRWLKVPGPAIRSLTLEELQRYDVGRLKPGSVLLDARKVSQVAASPQGSQRGSIPTVFRSFAATVTPTAPEASRQIWMP